MKHLLMGALLSMTASAGGMIEDFRWKKRLLVVTTGTAEIRGKLTASQPGLTERDIQVFFLNDPALDPALAKQLRECLKVRLAIGEVILLGKDGRTTLRWPAVDFTIPALFAKIDAMPMRKSEMRGD